MGTRARVVLVLLFAGLLGAEIGESADLSMVPSINARTEFNSNLNVDFTSPLSDFIATLSPAVEFNYNTEISQLQGKLGLTGLHYFSHPNLDHIDQNYQINGKYQLTPRWKLALGSAYIVDTTLQEELSASGLIMTRTPRQSILFSPGVTYNLTERLEATVSYGFNRVNYQNPDFQDYTYQEVGFKLEYPLRNEKTLLIGNILGREASYPQNDNYRSLGIRAGANHKFSERWELKLLGGANISFLNFQTQVQENATSFVILRQATFKKTEVSPFVALSTTIRWTNSSFTAGVGRDESPTAFGSISQVNQIFGALNYEFSEKWSGGINGNYYLTNQISNRNDLKEDFFGISVQLNYRMTEKLAISPGYRFGLRDDITNGRNATVQAAWLMITYSYPIHYQR